VKHLFKLLQNNGLMGARFRGITYFDDRHRCWLVADAAGRRLARHESPLPEAETFVIYDDARCRGADLKVCARVFVCACGCACACECVCVSVCAHAYVRQCLRAHEHACRQSLCI
jgi:hypothetical protein